MSASLVLLIFKSFPAQLAMLPYGVDSNVTKLLANPLTKPSVFYYFTKNIVIIRPGYAMRCAKLFLRLHTQASSLMLIMMVMLSHQ